MACGLPIIASRVSVIQHLIESRCGYVLDQPDGINLSEAIIKMVSAPKEMIKMSIKAREISRKYLLENWIEIINYRLSKSWGSQY